MGSIEATLETAEIAAVEQIIKEQILEGILGEDSPFLCSYAGTSLLQLSMDQQRLS